MQTPKIQPFASVKMTGFIFKTVGVEYERRIICILFEM